MIGFTFVLWGVAYLFAFPVGELPTSFVSPLVGVAYLVFPMVDLPISVEAGTFPILIRLAPYPFIFVEDTLTVSVEAGTLSIPH